MQELDELKELLLHSVRGIWRYRWISILIAWVVLIGGIISVDQIKNQYTAETKVYIDPATVLKFLRGLALESDFEEKVRLMVRQLLSRPNLERAIRKMDMDLDANSRADLDSMIDRVRNRVKISAIKKTGIYQINYTDGDRIRAKEMTQTLLDIFVEDSLGKSAVETDSAIEFLDKQIAKYESLLQEAENRREEFKRKNLGLMPKDGNTYYTQLQNANELLEQAEFTLLELNNRRNGVEAQIRELKSSEPVQEQPIVKSSLDERIELQERRLDDMLLTYTSEHPDVINAQYILEILKERKEAEVSGSFVSRSFLDSPIYQELQILLSTAEADISSIKARVRSLKRKQSELKDLVDIVPRIEGELQRLNRDYEVHKKNYTEFVSRREKAIISEEVDSGADQVKFRIIEPPYVPRYPDYPNRILFDLGVLMFAIGAGYGIGLLISLFQPVFYNQKDLMKYIGGSVLGAINKFDTPNIVSKRRKDIVLFSFINILFFCTAGLLIFLHSRGILILSQLHSMVI